MDQPLRDDGATWELPWTVLVRRYSLLSTIAVEERWKGQVVGGTGAGWASEQHSNSSKAGRDDELGQSAAFSAAMTHYAVWRLGGVLPASAGGHWAGESSVAGHPCWPHLLSLEGEHCQSVKQPCWECSPSAPSAPTLRSGPETIDAEQTLRTRTSAPLLGFAAPLPLSMRSGQTQSR